MNTRPYVSSELFHFVGQRTADDHARNWSVLAAILNSRCVSHPPHEVGWGTTRFTTDFTKPLEEGELITPTVTCYCDIPFESLSVHCAKYGKFGIALSRQHLVHYGARPVTYVPMESPHALLRSPFGRTLLRDFQCVYHALRNHVSFDPTLANVSRERSVGVSPESPAHAIVAATDILGKDVLAFLKPFKAHLPAEDPENHYMEREWRKFGNMMFEERDVLRVVVASGYADRVHTEFPAYSPVVCEV